MIYDKNSNCMNRYVSMKGFITNHQVIAGFFVWCLLGWARAERVTIQYVAQASTVTGQPFGFTVPRLTEVKGYFTYETNTPDLKPTDTKRGDFLMPGTWDFRAEFMGKVIRGSGTATASTNLFGSPTLRFNDGDADNTNRAGIMTIDGIADATIGLGFSISGQAKDLPTDQLPANFTFNPPPQGASHTFVLDHASGSMLLQFVSFQQVAPKIQSIKRQGDNVEIIWTAVAGKPYALEFSTDLQQWSRIHSNLIGTTQASAWIDQLSARYSGTKPPRGFYRIIDPSN